MQNNVKHMLLNHMGKDSLHATGINAYIMHILFRHLLYISALAIFLGL